MGRNTSNHSESPPIRVTGSSSHRRRSPPSSSRRERDRDRERSPSRRNRNSHSHRADTSLARDRSSSPPPPPREKQHHSSRGSAKMVKEVSGSPPPSSRSPSPRTKRLRRAQVDTGNERNHAKPSRRAEGDREHYHENERTHGSGRDRERGKGSDREIRNERKDKRLSGRDENNDNITDNSRGRSSISRHERPTNSPDRQHNGRSRHRSPSPLPPDDEVTNSRGAERRNDENDSIAKMEATQEALEEKQKQKPSFELSGKLAAETNRVKGVTLLFNEPPDARKPDIRWRLYVFKAGEVLNEPLYIHRQSCYLFGRERRVADIPTDHPSCSKQHAVIQFRQVEKEQPDGYIVKFGRPYLMDLGSTNKTFLNDNPIEPQRYYELREKDTIKFGNSSREYVLLHENSAQ
ncbi:FHA domain-containing protein DDL [Quillaja saponaria]|uniref:FHA domain-containing protein DDL n=1 Tax=Quillaja saponaria TaxID=32244 RepID=A0AAD7LM89_QUISA|nr:FHA domain-containing protein DDL [Quillaja saponaria]